MELRDFLKLLSNKKKFVFSVVLVFLAIATAFLLVTPLKYEASSRLIIVQSGGGDNYAITQSNIYVSNLLANTVNSSYFFKKVMDVNKDIDRSYFSATGSSLEIAKEWRRTVEARAVDERGGIIEVSVFHTDQNELKKLADSINSILETDHSDFHGLGKETINVKVIDQPVISDFPVKPNGPYIFALAFILGLITAASYVYLFSGSSKGNNNYHQKNKENSVFMSSKTRKYNNNYPDKKEFYPEARREVRPEYRSGSRVENNRRKDDRENIKTNEHNFHSYKDRNLESVVVPIKEEDPREYLDQNLDQNQARERMNYNNENSSSRMENNSYQKREEGPDNCPSYFYPEETVSPEEIEEKGNIKNIFG